MIAKAQIRVARLLSILTLFSAILALSCTPQPGWAIRPVTKTVPTVVASTSPESNSHRKTPKPTLFCQLYQYGIVQCYGYIEVRNESDYGG